MRVAGLLVTCLVAAGAPGCVRDPVDEVCPQLAEGDLVITEIGGPQTGADTLLPWVELYNATGASIDLLGTRLRFRKADGSSETDAIIRRTLTVAAGGYVTIGLDDDAALESYLSYGMSADFHTSWPTSAALDVETCGTRIDRVQYTTLPKAGTLSLGTRPPTATANDLPTNWCTDATLNTGSFPGSPQRANAACP